MKLLQFFFVQEAKKASNRVKRTILTDPIVFCIVQSFFYLITLVIIFINDNLSHHFLNEGKSLFSCIFFVH